MLYLIRRLIYDIFFRGSILKKIILLILLLLFFFSGFLSAYAEETPDPSPSTGSGGIIEPTLEPTAEPTPEPTAEPTPEPEPTPESITNVTNVYETVKDDSSLLEYLQAYNAEQEALALAEAEVYSLSQSQNSIIYGFLENYRWYYTAAENTSYQADQYIWLFDSFFSPVLSGSIIEYEGGCTYVVVSYSGNVSVNTYSSGSVSIPSGLVDTYSNFDNTDFPAVYQISKDAEKAFERFIETCCLFGAFYIGWRITYLVINGSRSGRGI